MNGIDVSRYQQNVDWKKVRAAGVEFAMVKAGQGGPLNKKEIAPFEDVMFEKHVHDATAAGVKCGAYFYLMGTTREEVLKEAEFFIKSLNKVRDKIVFPCAVDMEDSRYEILGIDHNTSLLKVFCAAVHEAGYVPIIYTNRAYTTHFINIKALSGYDVWFALYRKTGNQGPVPNDVTGITMWQWGLGTVNGVSGQVDMDIAYKDYAPDRELKAGDIVRVKQDAVYYFEGGPRIPSWVKGNSYRIAQTQSKGRDVIRGGRKCVLLGAYIDKNGEPQGSIMTWISVDGIDKVTALSK